MDILFTIDFWLALLTLTLLEIVLGVDNLIFISIVTNQLPQRKQKSARRIGLTLACLMRLGLLAALSWLLHLTVPLFTVFDQPFSTRDLILLAGGLFLLVKSTQEIHDDIEGIEKTEKLKKYNRYLYFYVLFQIMFLDIIFSLDSVITAIGLTQQFTVMAFAIVMAVILMIFASDIINDFINKYPTLKMLALSFLLLIGMALIADAFKFHIPRGYLYFSIAFSIFVEIINILARKKREAKKSG
jgi:predicted tellurium resistance membrane protein TerC